MTRAFGVSDEGSTTSHNESDNSINIDSNVEDGSFGRKASDKTSLPHRYTGDNLQSKASPHIVHYRETFSMMFPFFDPDFLLLV